MPESEGKKATNPRVFRSNYRLRVLCLPFGMTYRGVTRAFTPSVILEGVLVCHVSLRLMFAVRIVICINFKVCDKLEVYLRTWQYTASGMHTRGKTTLSCFLTPSCHFVTSAWRLFTSSDLSVLRRKAHLSRLRARSQNGSGVINAIHYRFAASLPKGKAKVIGKAEAKKGNAKWDERGGRIKRGGGSISFFR